MILRLIFVRLNLNIRICLYDKFIFNSLVNSSYLVTPYNVHRTNPALFEGNRVFVRLNFSPVEIEDYTNTENPMLKRKATFRRDVRDFLRTYIIDEFIDSGFNG